MPSAERAEYSFKGGVGPSRELQVLADGRFGQEPDEFTWLGGDVGGHVGDLVFGVVALRHGHELFGQVTVTAVTGCAGPRWMPQSPGMRTRRTRTGRWS